MKLDIGLMTFDLPAVAGENPRIPVYLAGVNPQMWRVAREVADGLHVHSFHREQYLRECMHPAVQEGLNRSGRSRIDFTFHASTRTYQPVLATHGSTSSR